MAITTKKIFWLVLLMACSCGFKVKADSKNFHISYVLDSISIDTTYLDNKARITEVREFLRNIRDDKSLKLDSIKFVGTASPDGYIERNEWLSRNRLEQFKRLVRREYDVPDSIIFRNDSFIPWERFRRGVEASDIPFREEVLEVLAMPADTVPWYRGMHTDRRLLLLRVMDKGRVWETLKPILAQSRYAEAEFVYHTLLNSLGIPSLNLTADVPSALPVFIPSFPDTWVRRLYLKTNLVEWALAIANFSVEIDIARHWTFALPLYYSRWDYFTPKISFRVAGFQPELRDWFNPKQNDGWFIGGHFGYSYYNMAFNGEERYQDYEGKTPAMGGGLAFGWRKAFGPGRHWRFEFSLGAGVYPLHYDVFENTPDYRDGLLIDTRRKLYYGLDRASLSIGYAFDLHRYYYRMKGGRK